MINAALDKHFGPLQATQATRQSTPPAPQEAPKEQAKQPLQQAITEQDTEITAEKQEQQPLYEEETRPRPQPLYQTTVEDDTETTAESTMHGNSMAVNKSTLSTRSGLCTIPASRDPAACLSKALLFTSQQAAFLAVFLGPLLGYIRYSASMEASGEG